VSDREVSRGVPIEGSSALAALAHHALRDTCEREDEQGNREGFLHVPGYFSEEKFSDLEIGSLPGITSGVN
jgi:hypothetical protein